MLSVFLSFENSFEMESHCVAHPFEMESHCVAYPDPDFLILQRLPPKCFRSRHAPPRPGSFSFIKGNVSIDIFVQLYMYILCLEYEHMHTYMPTEHTKLCAMPA